MRVGSTTRYKVLKVEVVVVEEEEEEEEEEGGGESSPVAFAIMTQEENENITEFSRPISSVSINFMYILPMHHLQLCLQRPVEIGRSRPLPGS